MIKRRESRPWNGYIHDIDDSRCDSFTEFGYEKNGVHVSRGCINITSPGDYYLDMHNNFHNNAYQQGELCPKIQAGELGNDTQLSPLYATDLLRLLSMQILRVWPVAVLAACHFLQLFLPAHVALNVGLFLGLLSLHQSQSDRRAAAQPDFQYAFGHIPGALNIPFDTENLSEQISQHSLQDRSLIVYCSSADCPAAEQLAARLVAAGCRFVRLYPGGWDDWLARGGDVAVSE